MASNQKRRTKERFVGLPLNMVESDEFIALSPRAKALLIDVAVQYAGFNNGALIAAWAHMRDNRGWRSKASLYKARKELVETGFLEVTHYQGRYTKLATYFAITWRSADDTDHSTNSVTPTHAWKKNHKTTFGLVSPTGGLVEANLRQKP